MKFLFLVDSINKFLSVQTLLLFEFAEYQKLFFFVILSCYCPKYINNIIKFNKNKKKIVVQKEVYLLLPQKKAKQRENGSN
jgi:hypothetical protein